MIRFVKLHSYNLVFLCCLFAIVVGSEFQSVFRNPSEFFKWSKCVYRNTRYNAGDYVKTGEPCLNCTCSNGAIVCHLRVCSPIPNPPPSGCFIVHKRNMCCAELVCNDDNNILFDGLEGRSRPGANEDSELELENFAKNRNTGCVINGTTYAEGSALSSSTDCQYCFCLKGKEQCMKPNCVLQLTGCTPVFSKHVCCPVKYNCHGSDNVTIISTELALTSTKLTAPDGIKELLSPSNKSQPVHHEVKSNNLATTRMMSTTKMMSNEVKNTLNSNQRDKVESSSMPFQEEHKPPPHDSLLESDFSNTNIQSSKATIPSSTEFVKSVEDNSTSETVTEISTSISLLKTELTVKEVDSINQSSVAEERKNTFSDIDTVTLGDSTQAYDRSSKANFTNKVGTTVAFKIMPPEIEAILNMTEKKQEGDYEMDYDEPTLPPSLPNLKIIPFVAADALDKPKDLTIQHREDVSVAVDVTDSIEEPSVPQAGQFSPPVKTEGGFVPRDPILDGPYFESKYSNVYRHTTEHTDNILPEQVVLPSITESAKVVENALCTYGPLTYRHGELISEPKACNMCLCMYGEIVCQKPECPTIKPGCQRINYEDVTNCCGEVICDEDVSTSTPTPTTEYKKPSTTTKPPTSFTPIEKLEYITLPSQTVVSQSDPPVTLPPASPTYMTIKVKGKPELKKPPAPLKITPTTHLPQIDFTLMKTSPTTHLPQVDLAFLKTTPTTRLPQTDFQLPQSTPSYSTEKSDVDYDSGFSFENMLSFLFDEPPSPHNLKNATSAAPTSHPTRMSSPSSTTTTTTTTTTLTTSTTPSKPPMPTTFTPFLTPTTTTTEASTPSTSIQNVTDTLVSAKPMNAETDSAIYVIRNNENQFSKTTLNYTDNQVNVIKQINSYYVPPLGNFEEVILNPTKKPSPGKKPNKVNPYFSTTLRPRHTTAKVIPVSRPAEKSTPKVIAGDPGAASGLLKLSGCNIFGRMYRLGKIIAELSGPCLQCMCAEVGVHCVPLKC